MPLDKSEGVVKRHFFIAMAGGAFDSSIFLLDGAARGEDTTFVFYRGVKRRGCPALSGRKGGQFFSDICFCRRINSNCQYQ